jgi:hypothetical protein
MEEVPQTDFKPLKPPQSDKEATEKPVKKTKYLDNLFTKEWEDEYFIINN